MSTSPDILILARPPHPGSGSTRPPSGAPSVALEGEAVPSRAPVRPAAYAAHRRFALHGALLLIAASASAAPAEAPWRAYAVYQPIIERGFVVDAAAQPLRYNHDSSVAWFQDRWFCASSHMALLWRRLSFRLTSRRSLLLHRRFFRPVPCYTVPSNESPRKLNRG